MSKGSNRRPTDEEKYREAFERIFGKPEQIQINASSTGKELFLRKQEAEDRMNKASEIIGHRLNGK